ncbi:MAG: class I SAM-dependent methyltransferase [Elusimicrobia bacterium]|nr:class I SAM-dependent methyltransferase [Elusimicrobiota bacterium]
MNSAADSDEKSRAYFRTRLSPDARRSGAWRLIARRLEELVPIRPDAAVLDLGAGYCDFINEVNAKEKHAVDLAPAKEHAAPGVVFHQTRCDELDALPAAHFDAALASNLFEHLPQDGIRKTLAGLARVLKPGGRLVVMQPNFRDCFREFYDDYTHVTPLTHLGLADLIASCGYAVEKVYPKFLPFSFKSSRLPAPAFLVWLYLRLPWKPRSGQCLIVAVR